MRVALMQNYIRERMATKGKRQKNKNIYFKHRCLTWKIIKKYESTQLWCVWPNPCSWQEGASADCCPVRVRYFFWLFLHQKSMIIHLLYNVRKSRKLIGTSSWPKESKKQEKFRSHWNKKKEKGFGSWLLRYQK